MHQIDLKVIEAGDSNDAKRCWHELDPIRLEILARLQIDYSK